MHLEPQKIERALMDQVEEGQGQGVGMQLLTHAIQAARARYSAVVLSVRTTNPAKALYERVGFVVVGTTINRVGTMSWVMRIDL